jgi:MoaA/NifB/PqqE/SkfB family radical SAM enzyme
MDMTPTNFRKVLDDLCENSIFFVHLSGGEPFLHPQFLEIVDYSCQKLDDVSILTNGTIIKKEHIDYFRSVTKTRVIKIQISIDSIFPEVNRKTRKIDPRIILENIEQLANSGVLLAAGMVVTRHNIDTLLESIRLLSKSIRYFHIMCIQDTEYDPTLERTLQPDGRRLSQLWDDLRRLQELYAIDISQPRDFMRSNYKGCAYGAPCAGAFTYAVIDPNLNVRPCDKLNSIILGNLGVKPLREVWNDEAAKRFLDNESPLCMSKRRLRSNSEERYGQRAVDIRLRTVGGSDS